MSIRLPANLSADLSAAALAKVEAIAKAVAWAQEGGFPPE
jgi:hypothetical protein